MMNFIRPKLCEIVARYSTSICNDPVRCEGLLRDFCGQYKRELFVLISALKEGIPSDLLNFRGNALLDLRISQLTERLHFNMSFERDAAKWAVESWALALGVVGTVDLSRPNLEGGTRPHRVPNKLGKDDLSDSFQATVSSGITGANAESRSNPVKAEVIGRSVCLMLSMFYFGFVMGWVLSWMC